MVNGSQTPYGFAHQQQHQQFLQQQHQHLQHQQQQHLQHQQQQQHQQQLMSRDDSILKLKRLDEINISIARIAQMLIQFFDEINKDRLSSSSSTSSLASTAASATGSSTAASQQATSASSGKITSKQAKNLFEEVIKHLKKVESDMLGEISAISMASTGHQHEGSIYGARKDFDLCKMQVTLVSSQLHALHASMNAANPDNNSSNILAPNGTQSHDIVVLNGSGSVAS